MKRRIWWVTALWALGAASTAGACPVTFLYDATAAPVTSVYVSGTFNGWAAPPDAWALTDPEGDDVWIFETDLEIETYLYKLVVDGVWMADPANPETDPDGVGGFNSVLDVTCAEPFFHLLASDLDESNRTYRAVCLFTPAGTDLDPTSIEVTLDLEAVPPGAVTLVNDQVVIRLAGLADGIHDVRLYARDVNGVAAIPTLLKLCVNREAQWSGETLYFVMTDRFRNGDPTNDDPFPGLDPRANYHGGDFRGVIDALQDGYFDQLGVTALWLSWPGENPDHPHTGAYIDSDDCQIPPGAPGYPRQYVDFSGYHGYWPKDPRGVEERFGSLAELQELVNAAHQRGIRVLLDLTINHVHEESPFYTDHPRSFFNLPAEICEDIGWTEPETCWFTGFLPDIRYEDERAGRSVLRTAGWWVEQTGCDGFRVDALKHIQFGFIGDLRAYLDSRFAATGVPFYLVGETFSGNPDDISTYIGQDLVHGQFNFPLNLSILKAFATEEKDLDDLFGDTRSFLSNYRTAHPGSIMSNFLGNHDIARFLSLAAGDLTCPIWDNISHNSQGWRDPPDTPSTPFPYMKLRLAFTYLMTIPGIPLIYYGDECGLPGAGDPDNRRPMPWDPDLDDNQQETLEFLRLLGSIRREWAPLREREIASPLLADPTFLAYARVTLDERVVVALNRSGEPATRQVRIWGTGLPDGAVLQDQLGGPPVTVDGEWVTVTLPPWEAAIYTYEVTGEPTPTPTVPPSPTPSGPWIELELEGDGVFTAGERFHLVLSVHNPGEARVVDVYVALDAYGLYFFWPGWRQDLDLHTQLLESGDTYQSDVLDFTWPSGAGAGSAAFWGVLVSSGGTELLDEPEYMPFSWM